MGEKQGQEKQASAGNERKEGEERKHKTTDRKRGGNSQQMFPERQSERPALCGKLCGHYLEFLLHQHRL